MRPEEPREETMKNLIASLALVSVMALGTASADARELRLASGAPPAHPAADPLYSTLMELLPEETNGELTGVLLGPEVVNIGQVRQALQSNLAEIGNLLPLFVPADLPSTALAGDLAFLATTPHAMGAAMTEYVVTCEDCQAEFREMGGVFLGSGSSDVYVLLTTKPVTTNAEMQGLRLRSGGAPYARWAEAMGASAAQIPVSDTFESISQGVVDGTMASVSDLISYRLVDVVQYIIDLPLGTYHTTSNFTVERNVWAELTPEQRAGLTRAANRANAAMTQSWGYERAEHARQTAREAGIEILEVESELLDATDAFREDDIAAAIEVATTQLGVTDAEGKIAHFQELVEKWTAIVEELDGDMDAIVQRVQEEVWDKVDYETYGL
jgi:TRAP-type transport system periplasmic protein